MTRLKFSLVIVFFLISGLVADTKIGHSESEILQNFKQNCWREGDRWLAKDKLKHFSSSMFIFITDYYYQAKYTNYTDQVVVRNSYLLSISFGIGKEIMDFSRKSRYFSIKDLIVDISGVVAGHIIVNNIR